MKCKYANRKLIHGFLCDDNSNICSICHHLRDICNSIVHGLYLWNGPTLNVNITMERKPVHVFLFDDNGNVCCISHHLQHIHKSNKMPKVWHWKWNSRSERRYTDFEPRCGFQIFSYETIYILAKGNTHTHTQKHCKRSGADCRKI